MSDHEDVLLDATKSQTPINADKPIDTKLISEVLDNLGKEPEPDNLPPALFGKIIYV